jgi:hypothetical protein
VRLPNKQTRVELITHMLNKHDETKHSLSSNDLEEIAQATEGNDILSSIDKLKKFVGYSGADLATLVCCNSQCDALYLDIVGTRISDNAFEGSTQRSNYKYQGHVKRSATANQLR